MISSARHHAEWLSLLEVSGPFLSMPVLLRAFPQGLDAADPEVTRQLRMAYDEWTSDQGGAHPSQALHTALVRFVLDRLLGMPHEFIAQGQDIPQTIKAVIAVQGETLRPDIAILDPAAPSSSAPRLLIQVLAPGQNPDKVLPGKLWKASPASRMAELLRATNIRLGLVTNGEQWMLVDAPQQGTAGFISWYASLWLEESITLRAFRSLLGVRRFFGVPDTETIERLLADSANDQQEITDQLGYQVRRAVEVLVESIDQADQDKNRTLLTNVTPQELYQAALTVMMRLVFLLCAEERGLLLLGDPLYDQNYAVSTLRAQLREIADQHGEEVLERRYDAWYRLLATFRLIHDGSQHDLFHLPAYGGGLFDPDRFAFLAHAPINNRTALHLLEALQILQVKVPGGGPAEARRMSYRALDVENIGQVYEGLLDHTAVRATEPVLGLFGSKDKEPEIPLSVLEAYEAKGQPALIDYLVDRTGRSVNTIKHALDMAVLMNRLEVACGNDETLINRVTPFGNLVREDDFGSPVVIPTGSVYVTAGTDRRSSGTHYTPRSFTETIVQHTLEPVVYIGPAEGLPQEQWALRTPHELLELKVCDMAMGSGAFTVQACRYLAERLVEAWEKMEDERGQGTGTRGQKQDAGARGEGIGRGMRVRITPEGEVSAGKPGETLIPQDGDERLILARRLVAERCIYGVDKNPLAVEIAKLSMWLTTMDKGRPFSFLDHALKCGDSLVGADEDMFERWAHSLAGQGDPGRMALFNDTTREQLTEAREKRRELESSDTHTPANLAHKEQLHREAEAAMTQVRRGCDLLIGTKLLGLKPKEQQAWQAELLVNFMAGREADNPKAQQALAAARKERAFHWPFEFPEVFEKGGFNAFVGNPPFKHGGRISSIFGDLYFSFISLLYPGAVGNADLCTYFLRRAFILLCAHGTLGFIVTNSIAEGDTSKAGLQMVLNSAGSIFRAYPDIPWPGVASVIVSLILIMKGNWNGDYLINGTIVPTINARLTSTFAEDPKALLSNSNRCYKGSELMGNFYLTKSERQDIISVNPSYSSVLKPFMGGINFTSSPYLEPDRWVVYFSDLPLETVEEKYPMACQILRRRFFGANTNPEDIPPRTNWWQFHRARTEIYRVMKNLKSVILRAYTSNIPWFEFGSVEWIVSNALVVVLSDEIADWAILNSSIHEVHAAEYGSHLKTDFRYTPSSCFDWFSFPINKNQNLQMSTIADKYMQKRKAFMRFQNLSLRDVFNEFNNPLPTMYLADIRELRELHRQLDAEVAVTYGWSDLDLGHGFHETAQGKCYTISEPARREVLARLLRLNHERYAEEVKAGLHEKKGGKGAEAKKKREGGATAGRAKAVKEDAEEYRLF